MVWFFWFGLVWPFIAIFLIISEYLSCNGFKSSGMKTLDDHFLWGVDVYIGCDVIRKDGLVDQGLHRFWTRWVTYQQRFLVRSEGWRVFSEALDKCEQFDRDEDVMVVYLLFNAGLDGPSRDLVERLASGDGRSAQDFQKRKGGVYPVEGQPSTFVAAAQAVLVKGRAFHCQIGLSKSDWLLRICEEARTGKIARDSPELHPLWFGIAVPLLAWTCKTVGVHYGEYAATCVCKNNMHLTNILWRKFKAHINPYISFGSLSERTFCRNRWELLYRDVDQMFRDMPELNRGNGSWYDEFFRRFAVDELEGMKIGGQFEDYTQFNRMITSTRLFLDDTVDGGNRWRLRLTPECVVNAPSFARQIGILAMQIDKEIVFPWMLIMNRAAQTGLPPYRPLQHRASMNQRLQQKALLHQDTSPCGTYSHLPLAITSRPMDQPEDLKLLYETLESLHQRVCILEAGKALPFKTALENTEKALKICDKIVNYEATIKNLVDDLNKIDGMCRQPNPDWLAIISEVLRVLSMEDAPKAQRDEDLIVLVENNLQSLDTIDTVAGLVEMDNGLGVMVSLQTVNDIRNTLDMVRNYEKTIKGIGMKYTLILSKIKGVKWDIPTIVSTTLEIIQIIQEEDIAKKQREEHLLACVKKSTEALRDSAAHVSRAKDVGLQTNLDSPFDLVLGTLDTVIHGVNAVINYQETIDQICAKYQGVAASLQRLATITDIKQVIPCLLDFVQVLHEEDYAKLDRNALLLKQMEQTNLQIKALVAALGNIGYTICSQR